MTICHKDQTMIQPLIEIEKYYEIPDPWGYQTHPEDLKRKNKILTLARTFGTRYDRALDIGCGEGWITKDLPAIFKFGYDISRTALTRLPLGVHPIDYLQNPNICYDLVITTGTLYDHYDYMKIIDWINQCSSLIVITCNISEWEVKEVSQIKAVQIYEEEFPYREFKQKLRVFRK